MSTTEQKSEAVKGAEKVATSNDVSVALTSREMLEALISDVHRELERIQSDEKIFVDA